MITIRDYFMGREGLIPKGQEEEIFGNARITVARASELLSAFGEDRKVTSGYRPASINKAQGGAPNSLHMYALAVDLSDPDRRLGAWCLANPKRLEEIGLWVESLTSTPGWVHVQCRPPKSGKRFFIP